MFSTTLAFLLLLKLFHKTSFYSQKSINLFKKLHKNGDIDFGPKEQIVSILFNSKMRMIEEH